MESFNGQLLRLLPDDPNLSSQYGGFDCDCRDVWPVLGMLAGTEV
ncbi:MAG: hypothetical protein ACTSRC_21985 [Candidatus Helarchaeota archaeon]